MIKRVYFDLLGQPVDFQNRWEARLAAWFAATPQVLARVSCPQEADTILILGRNRPWGETHIRGLDKLYPEKAYVWDSCDFPSGRLPGLYTGLPTELCEPHRHRSFGYPFRWNPLVYHAPLDQAVHLAGFRGSLTSPLRDRLVQKLQSAAGFDIQLVPSIWLRMDDPASRAEKQAYADHLASCRFILCPRGNGVSSVRLYEALEAGRVPVVLSDRLSPPDDPAWHGCVLHVPETRLTHLRDILREADRDWPSLARRARAYWEANYADSAVLPKIGNLLEQLGPKASQPGIAHYFSYSRYALRHLVRDLSRKIPRFPKRSR